MSPDEVTRRVDARAPVVWAERCHEAAAAIRWHMGPYRDRDAVREMSEAFQRFPLAAILHNADMAATYIIERGVGEKP